MKHDGIMCGEYAEEGYAACLARLFAALADAEKLRVLLALGDDEVSTNHLADILEASPADVQNCLDAYEELDLVRGTMHGNVRFFRIGDTQVRDLLFERVPAPSELKSA